MLSLKAFSKTTVDELFYINGGSGSGSSSSSGSSGSSSSGGRSSGKSGITACTISVGHVAPATVGTTKGVATGQRA